MTTTRTPPHGIGIIGLGAIGKEMLAAMSLHPSFTVRAAWDPDATVMSAALEHAASVHRASGAAEVVAMPGIHAVYVASPPATHSHYAHMAFDANLALLCEKPLGVDLEASRSIVERCAALDTANAVNFNHAAAFDAETLKTWLDNGELGDPHYVVMRLHLPEWPRPFQAHARWLAQREQGGFCREILSHWLYLSRKLLGDGEIVHAQTQYGDNPLASEQAVFAQLRFRDTPAYITAAVGGAGPIGMQYTLYASTASVQMTSGGGLSRWDGQHWARVPDPVDNEEQNDRARSLTQFSQRLQGRPNSCASLADALAVQELVEGILARSCR